MWQLEIDAIALFVMLQIVGPPAKSPHTHDDMLTGCKNSQILSWTVVTGYSHICKERLCLYPCQVICAHHKLEVVFLSHEKQPLNGILKIVYGGASPPHVNSHLYVSGRYPLLCPRGVSQAEWELCLVKTVEGMIRYHLKSCWACRWRGIVHYEVTDQTLLQIWHAPVCPCGACYAKA